MKFDQFPLGQVRRLLSSIRLGTIALYFLAGVSGMQAALSVTSSPSPVLVGSKLTFTFTLSGLGTTAGVFTNRLPASTVFVSAAVTNGVYTVSNNVFSYTPSITPAVSTIVFDVVLTPVTAQPITNVAYWAPSSGEVVSAGSLVPVTPVHAGPKLMVGRVDHRSTLLRDGRVLLTGGLAIVGSYLQITASAEVYDPARDAFSLVGSMGASRQLHTSTLLPNGMVLVAGGRGGGGTNASLELFDPTNNIFLPIVSTAVPRSEHSATLLTNGDVILAGGDGAGAVIERVSFTTGQPVVSIAGNLAVARKGHVAALLPSGEILFAGGGDSSQPFAEKYNPATGVSVPIAASGHTLPAVAVARGRVLAYGFTIQPDYAGETYDLESNTFQSLDGVPGPAFGANYLALSTGDVMISAGYNSFSVYLFNALAGTFTSSYPVNVTRSHHSAVELADGRVLLAGGYDLINTMSGDMTTTEVYAIRLDQDHDGMDDAWELANGFDPTNPADAIEDADGDGFTNLQEYLAGTDPHDPTSALRFESVQQEGSNLHIRFSSVLGKFYRVQRRGAGGGDWVSVTSPLAGTGRPIDVFDPIVSAGGIQLYRVLLVR